MIRSMTGYGAAVAETRHVRIAVEIRGVNHRHLDVRVGGAREFAAYEAGIRERIKASVTRGRVEVQIARQVQPTGRRRRVVVDDAVAGAYVRAARQLARRPGVSGTLDVASLLRLPDVCTIEETTPDVRPEQAALRRALTGALAAFERERRREGRHLDRDMRARIRTIDEVRRRLLRALPRVHRELRDRLAERVRQFAQGFDLDPARLTYEVATLVERGDVSEELVRLESHVQALVGVLHAGGPVGKRIEFLVQEVHRELNTTGAKLASPRLGGLVLQGKEAVEKLREQVQNVE